MSSELTCSFFLLFTLSFYNVRILFFLLFNKFYNSYTMKFILLKSTIQWLLTYLQSYTPITTMYFQTFSLSTPCPQVPRHISSHYSPFLSPWAWQPLIYFLSLWNILYKWNHTMWAFVTGFFHLAQGFQSSPTLLTQHQNFLLIVLCLCFLINYLSSSSKT